MLLQNWLTSRGYFLKAGSNRLLQYLWNHIVSSGRKMSRGVENAAFFVLISPNRVTCEINRLAIIRECT